MESQSGPPPLDTQSDERRQDFRADVQVCLSVDMPVVLSYESIDSPKGKAIPWQWDDLAVSPDMVKAMLAEADLTTQEPLLLQMLVRIDWMLTSVLKTLAKDQYPHSGLPEFLTANLSASGIRFLSGKEFQVGDRLFLKLVLRPFVPTQAVGKVLRVQRTPEGEVPQWETACEFLDIAEDDRDAIIRHVLRAQAVLQRRRAAQVEISLGV